MANNFTDGSDTDSIGDPPNYEKDLATGTKAKKNSSIHKRIDELLEKKRLKELLDDENDWTV
jgi:hypothetical protein